MDPHSKYHGFVIFPYLIWSPSNISRNKIMNVRKLLDPLILKQSQAENREMG